MQNHKTRKSLLTSPKCPPVKQIQPKTFGLGKSGFHAPKRKYWFAVVAPRSRQHSLPAEADRRCARKLRRALHVSPHPRTKQSLSHTRSSATSASRGVAELLTGPVSVCEIPLSDCAFWAGGISSDAIDAEDLQGQAVGPGPMEGVSGAF